MSASQRLRQQGFTLLELLIALTLLGLILVLLFGGLRLGMRSWDVSQKQVDNLNSVRSLEGFLRREMSVIAPYRWKSGVAPQLAFLGERQQLSFVAPLPSRVSAGGLYAVSISLEVQGQGKKRIVWRYLPVNGAMQDFSSLAQAPQVVLASSELDEVEDIGLSYFGQENSTIAPRWMDRWDSKAALPLLIRIQVKLKHGAEWPDFVVAPLLSGGLAP